MRRPKLEPVLVPQVMMKPGNCHHGGGGVWQRLALADAPLTLRNPQVTYHRTSWPCRSETLTACPPFQRSHDDR